MAATLLADLVQPSSHDVSTFVVLQDTVDQPLRGLWHSFLDASLASDKIATCVALFEPWQGSALHSDHDRLHTLDFVTTERFTLEEVDRRLRRLAKQLNTFKCALFLDSLLPLITSSPKPELFWRHLKAWTGLFNRVVLLHHKDTVVSDDTNITLAALADAIVTVVDNNDETQSQMLPVPLVKEGPISASVVLQRRGTRPQREKVHINLDRSRLACSFTLAPIINPATINIATTSSLDNKPDPTANLPFNLTLTDKQKEARAGVLLPYLKAQDQEVAAAGVITYDPDTDDDFDDEDPDDDLDI